MALYTIDADTIEAAKFHQRRRENPWAPMGLHNLDDIPKREPMPIWRTCFDWPGVALSPGTVSVVTGLPGSGKTHLMAQIWNHVVGKYGLVMLVASFECPPVPNYVRYLREIRGRRREAAMSEQEIEAADQFIRDHYKFLIHPEEKPELYWLLNLAEIAIQRDGVKVIQLDPWNRLESQRKKDETEPEYVARCLRDITVFAKHLGVHVQIVAHPAKRDGPRRSSPPDLEDIAGAMHWWNMMDQGFVVHREKAWTEEGRRCFDAQFTHRKARFEELGYPCSMDIRFNPQSRIFESVVNLREQKNGRAAVERRQGGLAGGLPASKDENEPPPPSYE